MPSYSLNKPLKSRRPRVAITIGDPFGIGPEIVLKALASPTLSRRYRSCDFLVIGDKSALSLFPKLQKAAIKACPHISITDSKLISGDNIKLGRWSRLSGRASLAYIDCAIRLIKGNEADCLVTAPVCKEAIASGGLEFSGHTEYIARAFNTNRFAMMLIGGLASRRSCGPLRVTLVTRHIPIKAVSEAITKKEILKCIKLSYAALKGYFGIKKPLIGVASLNPHGGEGSLSGGEEERIIRPAVEEASKHFKGVFGPVSSEALFYEALRGRIDCIIAMYHDQGLTPLKMIARDESVNVTLGLPFIRTSPGHGTAFDIAGKDVANPASMIQAIKTAVEMC